MCGCMAASSWRFTGLDAVGQETHRMLDVTTLGSGPTVVFVHGSVVGATHETPEELEGELLHGTRLLMNERPPWDGDPPLDALVAAPFPKLVISGGHSAVFEKVCDVVAERIHGERAVIRGRGHTIP